MVDCYNGVLGWPIMFLTIGLYVVDFDFDKSLVKAKYDQFEFIAKVLVFWG